MSTKNIIAVPLKINAPTVIFMSSSKDDTIMTVELISTATEVSYVNLHVAKNITDKPTSGNKISITVPVNGTVKKRNVCIPSGMILLATSTSPFVKAKTYPPSLYASPGELDINPGQSANVKVYLAVNSGDRIVRAISKNSTIDIVPTSAKISNGNPVTFRITRTLESVGKASVSFLIDDLKIGTSVDIDEIVTEVEDWSPNQMAMFYSAARDLELKKEVR